MGIGARDFIVVIGEQGYGKSVWTKEYCRSKKRLLLYDPKAEYPNVDYLSPPDEWLRGVIRRETPTFRFGTYHAEEVEMFGSAAYAAGNCCFAMEECAMLFERGETVQPWARPLIYMGREIAVDLVLIAQRANMIPIGIRSQASRIVSFFQSEPADVKALCARIGGEHEEALRTLAPLECLDWHGPAGVRRYRVRP